MDESRFGLANIDQGAVIKTIDRELAMVAENIMDPNTEAKAPRKVTLELIIKPEKDREVASFVYKVKSTLAPPRAEEKRVYLGLKGGKAFMALGHSTPLFDQQAPADPEAEENPKKGRIEAVK